MENEIIGLAIKWLLSENKQSTVLGNTTTDAIFEVGYNWTKKICVAVQICTFHEFFIMSILGAIFTEDLHGGVSPAWCKLLCHIMPGGLKCTTAQNFNTGNNCSFCLFFWTLHTVQSICLTGAVSCGLHSQGRQCAHPIFLVLYLVHMNNKAPGRLAGVTFVVVSRRAFRQHWTTTAID